jgi:hypothetical protein
VQLYKPSCDRARNLAAPCFEYEIARSRRGRDIRTCRSAVRRGTVSQTPTCEKKNQGRSKAQARLLTAYSPPTHRLLTAYSPPTKQKADETRSYKLLLRQAISRCLRPRSPPYLANSKERPACVHVPNEQTPEGYKGPASRACITVKDRRTPGCHLFGSFSSPSDVWQGRTTRHRPLRRRLLGRSESTLCVRQFPRNPIQKCREQTPPNRT